MSPQVLVTGGLTLTAAGMTRADVLLEDGAVASVGPDLRSDSAVVIDAEGAWVGPAFVDLHCHLREPGHTWKEDISSGRAAAAAGGYCAVVAMPNTDPAIDSGHLAREVARTEGVRVIPAGAVTMGREGQSLAHLDELWAAGVRLYTDDGDTVADAGLLRRAMEYLGQLGGVVAQHAEEPGLCRGGHMHEGVVSSRLGMVGLPAIGEEVIVARDLRLVELTGCRYHVQHVSTAGTVELVRAAKEAGLPVTAEVAPHHLALDHQAVATMDPVYKMYPPLRRPEDVASCVAALDEGIIDAVATDHAPHAAFEKEVPFEEAPRGVIGLETAAAVVNQHGLLDPPVFFERMSQAPRRILGEEPFVVSVEAPADLVVFHPERMQSFSEPRSRSANSPWLGADLKGTVLATIVGGEVVHTMAP